jgi:hypothetical protein
MIHRNINIFTMMNDFINEERFAKCHIGNLDEHRNSKIV